MLLRGACKLLGSRETVGLTKMVTCVWNCYWVGQWGGENGSRGRKDFDWEDGLCSSKAGAARTRCKDLRIGCGAVSGTAKQRMQGRGNRVGVDGMRTRMAIAGVDAISVPGPQTRGTGGTLN